MSNRKRTGKGGETVTRLPHRRLIALGLLVISLLALVAGWSAAGHDAAAAAVLPPTRGSDASENDIAGVQAAESGTAGEPVLVWFHADW